MSDIDKLFEEIDFNFEKRQAVNKVPVNNLCRAKLFPAKRSSFNLSLANIKNELAKNNEVEVRFGYFSGRKFIPGVPKEAFYNLLQVLQKTEKVEAVVSIDYIVDDGVRITEIDGKKIAEKKTRIEYRDLPAWGLRISASSETRLGEMEADKYDISTATIRRKTRWSFTMKTRRWDLTIVTDPNTIDRDAIFEVETEYFPDALNDALGFEGRIQKDYIDTLKHLYKSSEENLLNAENIQILMDNYNNLFDCNKKQITDRFNDLENKPQSFDFKNIFSGLKYYITPKLDGLRRRLFVDVNGIFIIVPGTRYAEQIAGPIAPIADTVLDTEYYKGQYYPFDVLFFDGQSYLNKPFSDRIASARKIELDVFNFDKPFFLSEPSFYDAFKKCLEWQSENPDMQFDGQIAQTEIPPYKSMTTMKIKPLEEMTVDLLTEIDSKGHVTFKSYDKSGLKIEKMSFGGDAPIKWKDIRGSADKRPKINGFIAEYNLLKDFPWVKFKGYRIDKIKPNFSNVVSSVKYSFYNDPVTEEDLLGETLLPWRKWASLNKRKEIAEYIPTGSRILDIGVGRGGTLREAAKVGQVFGIDPSKKNLDDLWLRINNSMDRQEGGWTEELKGNVMTMVARGQDTEEIEKFIGDKVDAVLSMYSLSFFFESEADLDALIQTIDNTLDTNGVVLFNFMDGERVGERLLKGNIDTDLYSIKLGHKGKKDAKKIKEFKEEQEVSIGIPIAITFKNEDDPIFKYQEEWLAPFNVLKDKMTKKGFTVIKDQYLDQNAILPYSNDEFAELNRTVIFKRGGIIRQRPVYKNQREDDIAELQELRVGKSEKWGKYVRHGVVWDESSFIASALYGQQVDIKNVRQQMYDLLTEKMFSKLKKGNVKKRLAFDKLYTLDDGKLIDTEKDSLKAGYKEYRNRLLSGPIGHEAADLLTNLFNIQIVVLDGFKTIQVSGNDENIQYVLKIGDYAYSPLTLVPNENTFKSARTEETN